MSTSSSSSSTSLRRRWPGGRGLVDGTSWALTAPGSPGLIVSREDPGPGREGLGGGGGDGALVGRSTALAALLDGRLGVASAARAFEVRAAGRSFPDPRLEELTPELPDPADRVRERLQGHDRGGTGCGLDDGCVFCLWNPFRVDPDHAVVNAAFEDDQRPDTRITFEPSSVRDLQPADGNDVPAHQPRDRDHRALYVGFHVGFRADEQVPVALDLTAEMPQDLAVALDLKPPAERVVSREHRRLRLGAR